MYTIKLPQYSIGKGSIQNLSDICMGHGKKGLVIGGKTALEKTEENIKDSLQKINIEIADFIWYGGECSFNNIEMLKEKAESLNVNMLIGVGGGKALDTTKAVGEKTGLPVITVPTIASTCAATTMLSVIYEDKGDFNSIYLLNNPPVHILIDTEISAKSPTKYLWAGRYNSKIL